MSGRGAVLAISLALTQVVPAWSVELMHETFTYPDGLITNEYAFWNPTDRSSIKSPIWELTSGSLFAQGNQGWTGIPDDTNPNTTSSNGNDSAIFRMTTVRSDFGDVAVSFSALNQGLTTTASTPAVAWDGFHIFLRYQSEYNLYYASVNRRDNTCIIKKKIPGGPSNGGTYYDMSPSVSFRVPYNAWQQVKATVKNNGDGSVTVELFNGGTKIVSMTDNGSIGGPPITNPGKVGIRGDNANLKFDDFTVSTLVDAAPPPVCPLPVGGIISPAPQAGPVTTTSVERKTARVLNQAAGDRQLVLYCEDGSPLIIARTGQVIRRDLPQISSAEYAWDGTTDSGTPSASGTYREQCGRAAHTLVYIH